MLKDRALDHEGHSLKPVNFNQLLFHPKTDCLSFFLVPSREDPALVLQQISHQLELKRQSVLNGILNAALPRIHSIIRTHAKRSIGFFISSELQGHVLLDDEVENFFILGQSFHVRPLLEHLLEDPEFMVVNVSMHDLKLFRGSFHGLEIVQQWDYDQVVIAPDQRSRVYLPQQGGLLSHMTLMIVKKLAVSMKDNFDYASMPVLIAGLGPMKEVFLRYFDQQEESVIDIPEDFFEKTCVEILEMCRPYRHQILQYHSQRLVEKIMNLVHSRLLISDLGEIIRQISAGEVIKLILPRKIRLYGQIDLAAGTYQLAEGGKAVDGAVDILNEMAEEVMRQDGRIILLNNHFFPAGTKALAVLRSK
jgi:hypothetical protein